MRVETCSPVVTLYVLYLLLLCLTHFVRCILHEEEEWCFKKTTLNANGYRSKFLYFTATDTATFTSTLNVYEARISVSRDIFSKNTQFRRQKTPIFNIRFYGIIYLTIGVVLHEALCKCYGANQTPLSVLILHHHHHLPPWIRSFDLFRHRRIAMVSWGVHGLFFLEVCS